MTSVVSALTTLLLVAAFLVASAGAAEAAGPDRSERRRLPVAAGTILTFEGGRAGPAQAPDDECTAGPTLTDGRIFAGLTPRARALRFVLTAGHCASAVGQRVRVGDVEVGEVHWISATHDLALVRIEPSMQTGRHCGVTSTGPYCDPYAAYTPRAEGKIITASQYLYREHRIPVRDWSDPAAHQDFCSTGSETGSHCSWVKVAWPQGATRFAGEQPVFSQGQVDGQGGDSGAAMYSLNGMIHGILTGPCARDEADGSVTVFPGTGRYVPYAVFHEELPYYALARDR